MLLDALVAFKRCQGAPLCADGPSAVLVPGGIALYDCGKESRGHLTLCTQGTKAQESHVVFFFFFFFFSRNGGKEQTA